MEKYYADKAEESYQNRLASRRKYYRNNREKILAFQALHRDSHREEINLALRLRYATDLVYKEHKMVMTRNRKATRKNHDLLVGLLGGQCTRCGFNDRRALQLDHRNGGGTKHRTSYKGAYYIYIKEHLDEFDLLCANCNWIKRDERKEYWSL